MNTVLIVPLCNRAKQRCMAHGNKMKLIKKGMWDNKPSIFCESLENTFGGNKWAGWFVLNEEVMIQD